MAKAPSAIDAKPTPAPTATPPSSLPAATPVPTPWAPPAATTPPAAPAPAVTPEPAATTPSEPPAGTPLTAEERAANGLSPETAETPEGGLVQTTPPAIAPVEDNLTLDDGEHAEADEDVREDEPTGGDGRPDGFIPGDQTAAGALTPLGGRHPGKPRSLLPGEPVNLQDPYNVNGTARNQELLAAGHGIKNPKLD